MNYPKRNLTLWTLAFCVLLTTIVLPVLANTQTASSDTSADTTTKPKKRRHKKLTTESSADPASAATPAAATSGTTTNSAPQASSAPTAGSGKTKDASGNTNPEIAAAKASGKVWVNIDSGIYHNGGRWYGKTKNGKFMTEAEAKAAGYKPSRRD